MGAKSKNWRDVGQRCRSGLARIFRGWAEALDPGPKLPRRRLSLVTVVDERRQAKFGRKLEKYRDRRDVDDVSRAWARKQCVLRTVAMLQSMPRDYFVFEDYKDDSGNIIVRSTLKVLKDD